MGHFRKYEVMTHFLLVQFLLRQVKNLPRIYGHLSHVFLDYILIEKSLSRLYKREQSWGVTARQNYKQHNDKRNKRLTIKHLEEAHS